MTPTTSTAARWSARRAGYATSIASQCRDRGVAARTVSVKVRYGDFEMVVRSKTDRRPVTSASEIAAIAVALLGAIGVDRGVRLLGVSVSNLEEASPPVAQLELFDEPPVSRDGPERPRARRSHATGEVTDAIQRRFGRDADPAQRTRSTLPSRDLLGGVRPPRRSSVVGCECVCDN